MELFFDIWIMILQYLLKEHEIESFSKTCSEFQDFTTLVLTKKCRQFLLEFKESSIFWHQGETYLSQLKPDQLIEFFYQMKECYKQREILKNQLIVLQHSNHPDLFKRFLKLFSNKEFNRFYQHDLKTFASAIDKCAESTRFLEMDKITKSLYPNIDPLSHESYIMHELKQMMMQYQNPLKKYNEFCSSPLLQKYIQAHKYPSIFLRCFKKNLTVEQIEKSLQSFENNDIFKLFSFRLQLEFVSDYLGCVCRFDDKKIIWTFEDENYSQIIVRLFFADDKVEYVEKNVPKEWIPFLSVFNFYNLLTLPKETFDILLETFHSQSNIKFDNELVFMTLLKKIKHMKPRWVKKFINDNDCVETINYNKSLQPKFFYFLDPKARECLLSLKLSTIESSFYQKDAFDFLFERDVDSLNQDVLKRSLKFY